MQRPVESISDDSGSRQQENNQSSTWKWNDGPAHFGMPACLHDHGHNLYQKKNHPTKNWGWSSQKPSKWYKFGKESHKYYLGSADKSYGRRIVRTAFLLWFALDKSYGDKLYGLPWLGVDKSYGLDKPYGGQIVRTAYPGATAKMVLLLNWCCC